MESQALFREIHKNTWLKRVIVDNRKTTVIGNTKKLERFWVVFCVHDDSIALLEGYSEPKMAPSHNPEWTLALQTTQHVSHSLVPIENEYEFVITLMDDVARFNAPSWDLMQQWVDTLRSKLREMKILSPKDNLYSKLPEARLPLLPTRDPTSPLPAPPPVPAALVPGVERIHLTTSIQTNTTTTLSNSTPIPITSVISTPSTSTSPPIVMSNTNVENLMNLLSNPLEAYSIQYQSDLTETPISPDILDESQSMARTYTNHALNNIPTRTSNRKYISSEQTDDDLGTQNEDITATNITIIQVSTPQSASGESLTNELSNRITEDYRSNVQIIPSNPTVDIEDQRTEIKVKVKSPCQAYKVPHKSKTKIGIDAQITTVQVSSPNHANDYGQVFPTSTTVIENHAAVTNISISQGPFSPISSQQDHSSQHYEQVFLSTSAPLSSIVVEPSTSTGVRIISPPNNILHPKRPDTRPVLTRGLTEVSITRPSRRDNREQALRIFENRRNIPENQVDEFRNENQEQRRRSCSASDAHTENRNRSTLSPPSFLGNNHEMRRLQLASQHYRGMETIQPSEARITLREQQVMQLRREMMHPGGVRVQLRRKDCINSIGWVDAFGRVWIAGWKQKEHPVLYNALHIGDQLLSIAGRPAATAAEANKLIRACQGLFVELIIRRVPYGQVYAIKREIEGQCLGLIRDGNSAVIVDVVPNSLAARFGLPPKTKTIDGSSYTFWVMTEINSRPLNLFFKDTEIQDRLNSVGKDISLLVQPSDLVTKLKKQLKSLRSYKDFIVQ